MSYKDIKAITDIYDEHIKNTSVQELLAMGVEGFYTKILNEYEVKKTNYEII